MQHVRLRPLDIAHMHTQVEPCHGVGPLLTGGRMLDVGYNATHSCASHHKSGASRERGPGGRTIARAQSVSIFRVVGERRVDTASTCLHACVCAFFLLPKNTRMSECCHTDPSKEYRGVAVLCDLYVCTPVVSRLQLIGSWLDESPTDRVVLEGIIRGLDRS